MNIKNDKKKILVLSGIGLLTVLGGTLAYFTSSTNISNKFQSGIYENQIVEEFESPSNWTPGTKTTKTVNVKNTGNVSMAVRASIEEDWVSANGSSLGLFDEKGNRVALIEYGDDWSLGSDGYYYYGNQGALTELKGGNITSDFIKSVTFNGDIEASLVKSISPDGKTVTYSSSGLGYDNATYTLIVKVDTVQYDQADNVWGR